MGNRPKTLTLCFGALRIFSSVRKYVGVNLHLHKGNHIPFVDITSQITSLIIP